MSIDLPGFVDPVAGAQEAFRAVLDAMSRPGSLRRAGLCLTPPSALSPATAAVLLTLIDADTPLWCDPAFAAAAEWIAFHCGAPQTEAVASAAFLVTPTLPDLATLQAGTDEGPEEAATVILQVAGLGTGRALRLAGPGLRMPEILRVDGLPSDFVAVWDANHARFPRGVDIILCAGDTLAALPRSVSIMEV